MSKFEFNEKYLSQIPAIQLLVNEGYEYLTPDDVLAMRDGKRQNVLLAPVLRKQLKKINRIRHRGAEHRFSEENVQTAMERLTNVRFEGLQKTNEELYDLLTLGVGLEQSIDGDLRTFSMNYIDWRNIENNVFHVSSEFSVVRNRRDDCARPDVVLFVNGIPLGVMECKAPSIDVDQAVSQMIRNQRDDHIPRLFAYSQLLVGANKNRAKYATTGTPSRFWSVWREDGIEDEVARLVNTPLDAATKDRLFTGEFASARTHFDDAESSGDRIITEQDRALHALCRPARLLEIAREFTVFDGGIRKVARYQQFDAVNTVVDRVSTVGVDGKRKGGIIWHTQGSGKSLTMVMLARALAMDPRIKNPRIVLVTDRVDLDKQLGNTFAACGLTPERAASGRHLLQLVSEERAQIITAIINKFDTALSVKSFEEESSNVFVLVDESHRTNSGSFAARMRRVFPNGCYIGFTGTPLLKGDRNSFQRFGGLIHSYNINRAVEDEAVVPLVYEGRHVELDQNKAAIDVWFERHTKGLTDEQKADLKRKYSKASALNRAEQVVYLRAFDISEHFRENWQGTGLKAQLVAPSKASAIRYKEILDEIGHVSSEVIISPPDLREGYEDLENEPAVVTFWNRMMSRFGSEEEYNKQLINRFKYNEEPEVLIVVDKLLTGFDAPRNTVLYLTRKLTAHTLLQAVARVNRLFSGEPGVAGKEYGFVVDYEGVLGELDRTMSSYSALEGFDEQDLIGTLSNIRDVVASLPQRHAELLEIFKEISNQHDEEAYEVLLGDEDVRELFYERLAQFARTLATALSSEEFLRTASAQRIDEYKSDLKRFQNLKAAVKLRYAESVDYRDYEPKIQKLLDTHITATDVSQVVEPVNVFDESAFGRVLAEQGARHSTAAAADMIAHATKRAIHEHMDEDPAFYGQFSELIQQTIDAHRAERISDAEYLAEAQRIREAIVHRSVDDVPAAVRGNPGATAIWGLVRPIMEERLNHDGATHADTDVCAEAGAAIWRIIEGQYKVGFWDDVEAQRRTANEIDDFLYDEVKEGKRVDLTASDMDDIIAGSLQLARHRLLD
ncbi:MAG: type restriction-modification system, subunit [Thermoleophilia bacterium]|nr:type restriction-modification system, subunit [Thermoleophilia bacterium]